MDPTESVFADVELPGQRFVAVFSKTEQGVVAIDGKALPKHQRLFRAYGTWSGDQSRPLVVAPVGEKMVWPSHDGVRAAACVNSRDAKNKQAGEGAALRRLSVQSGPLRRSAGARLQHCWVQREQLLRAAHSPQRIAPDRNEPVALRRRQRRRKCGRNQHAAFG